MMSLPHSPSAARRLPAAIWVTLAVLAALALVGGGLAWKYRQRARRAEARAPLPKGEDVPARIAKAARLNQNERKYLDALADRFGFHRPRAWTMHDVLMLSARLNEQLNALSPPAYDAARTPWLLPVPKTLPARTLAHPRTVPVDLAKGHVDLPVEASLFQYTIANPSSVARPMPILFQDVRWDSAEGLLESSSLARIEDELDRAVAVWRFIAERRCHGQPVTEGSEEHDLIKFLSCHGYGFCDDSAQAVCALGQACGLQARICGLNGHVVPELFAGGRWRMFDADFAVYFHAAGDPRRIYGVDDLEQGRAAFEHAVTLGAAGPWNGDYATPFLSRDDNHAWPLDARRQHIIIHTLAPGESVTFSNFNWGRYFLGAYPHKPPRFYNGCFDCPLTAALCQADPGARVRAEGGALVMENSSAEPAGASVEFHFPFPIVGGEIAGLPESVSVEYVEGERHAALRAGPDPSLDGAVTQLSESPTYGFVLHFRVPPHGRVRLDAPPHLLADFQFAEFALLKLKPGPNKFRVHGSTDGLRSELHWQ